MIEKATFLIFEQNIHVDSNENLQSIAKINNSCKPQFYHIKNGVRGGIDYTGVLA